MDASASRRSRDGLRSCRVVPSKVRRCARRAARPRRAHAVGPRAHAVVAAGAHRSRRRSVHTPPREPDSIAAVMKVTPRAPSDFEGTRRAHLRRLAPLDLGRDRLGAAGANVGERLEIALAMPGGMRLTAAAAAPAPWPARVITCGASPNGKQVQHIRRFLLPLEPAFVAVDRRRAARSRCRARPGRPTACRARRPRSAAASVAVVVDPAAGDEGGQIGAEGLRLQPRDEAREIVGMRADVADRAAARLRRVGAPRGLLRPAASSRVVSQSCGWLPPGPPDRARLPARTRPRASRTSGWPVRLRVRPNTRPVRRTVRTKSRASSTVVVIGLSQITWMPASRNALAAGWWR